MSNNLGLIFAFFLILPVILFGADLYLLSNIQVTLEARATTAGYRISLEGGVRQSLVDELASEDINLYCVTSCETLSVGASVHYGLSKVYSPIILAKEPLEVVVSRVIIVGYL